MGGGAAPTQALLRQEHGVPTGGSMVTHETHETYETYETTEGNKRLPLYDFRSFPTFLGELDSRY
jgi:hypothetical protein